MTCRLSGGYFGYEYIHAGGIPFRLRGSINVMTNAGIVYGGPRVMANGSLWVPVHHRVLLGLGLGLTWTSGSFNRTYYGVTPEDSAASGLPVYGRRTAARHRVAGSRLPDRQALVCRRNGLHAAHCRERR